MTAPCSTSSETGPRANHTELCTFGFVISCPGATLVTDYVQGTTRTPAVLEVLVWQFIRVLGETRSYPSENQELLNFLTRHYYDEVCVRLIPLRDSLLEHKQKNYDWIATVRDDYGLGMHELRNDTIMSLQDTPPMVHQIYSANNCHFRATVADQVIGLLLGRSLTKMRQMRNANPNAVHILVVCSWNCTRDRRGPP